jgi:hypothetical protein
MGESMADKKKRLLVFLAALGLVALLVMTILNTTRLQAFRKAQSGADSQLREDLLNSLLGDKVESIVAGAATDQERCLRLARWIAGNIRNEQIKGEDHLGHFVRRRGLCGYRAGLFVQMCSFLYIHARNFNLYNFGGVPGDGHSCAQAWYDNQWHYFDVTYAGVFMRDGKVLSWDEIRSQPEQAAAALVPFDLTLDRHGPEDTSARVVNADRMRQAYSPERIRQTVSCGFLRYLDAKTLHAPVSLADADLPLVLGKRNQDSGDVSADGVARKISEQLGFSLGVKVDFFQTRWEFRNCRPGKTYVIRYHLYRTTKRGLAFWAKAEGADITSGADYTAGFFLSWRGPSTWEIKCTPRAADCAVTVGYDFRTTSEEVGVDQIEILPG